MATNYTATRFAGDTGTPTTVAAIGDASNDTAQPFACRAVQVTVDFGVSSDRCRTSVAGVPWVLGRSPRPHAQVVGRPATALTPAYVSDEDALNDQVLAIVTNIVDATTFDVIAYAPGGSSGVMIVQVYGV